jgi:hypothetical protein
MKGRHTATNIFSKYTEITGRFKVDDKVTDNVTDAAANMKKALGKTSFINKQILNGVISEYNSHAETASIVCDNDDEVEDEPVQNETLNDAEEIRTLSQTTHDSDSESTTKTLTSGAENADRDAADIFLNIFDDDDNCPERHNCVIHQLQLVIKESKVGCGNLDRSVEHVATYIAKGSHSYLIKENLELTNGFLGKRNATRWNSEHKMCSSFINFTEDQLKQIYGDEVVLTLTQRQTLEEFVRVLEPFLESTLLLQKEAFSIGHVLPSIRGENLIFPKF